MQLPRRILVLLFSICVFFNLFSYSSNQFSTRIEKTHCAVPSDEITIASNLDFTTANFSGEGTIESPYLFRNALIEHISIMNTDAHVVLRNCQLHGLLADNVTNIRIENSEIFLADSFSLVDSKNIEFSENTIEGWSSFALENCSLVTFGKNQIMEQIDITSCQNVQILDNSMVLNGDFSSHRVLNFLSSVNCHISNNLINATMLHLSSLETGISIGNSVGFRVEGNIIVDAICGIEIWHTSNSRFFDNTLRNCQTGFEIDRGYGEIYHSRNNTYTHNIFVDNSRNVRDNSYGILENNIWISNYYSDYIGFGTYQIGYISFDYTTSPSNPIKVLALLGYACVSAISILYVWSWKVEKGFLTSGTQNKIIQLLFLVILFTPYMIILDIFRGMWLLLDGFAFISNLSTGIAVVPLDWLSIDWMIITIPHIIVYILILGGKDEMMKNAWKMIPFSKLLVVGIGFILILGLVTNTIPIPITILVMILIHVKLKPITATTVSDSTIKTRYSTNLMINDYKICNQ